MTKGAPPLAGLRLGAWRVLWRLLRRRGFLNIGVGGVTIRARLAGLSSRYLARAVPDPIRADGHVIFHGFGSEESMRMATGAYEPETTAIIRALLRPGQTFVDVGAHVGYFTLLGARAVGPTGQVYAFEPAPTNLAVLAKNIQANGYDGRVTVVPKAVSNRSGTSRLFVADSDSMWHTILPHWGGTHIEVVTTTLDEFFEQAGWPPIHFVKIDVEGAEKEALEGMAGLSRRNPWLKLAVEFATSNFPPGNDPEDVFRVLRDLGFVRLSIISRELIPVGSHREMLERSPASASWSNLLCEK